MPYLFSFKAVSFSLLVTFVAVDLNVVNGPDTLKRNNVLMLM